MLYVPVVYVCVICTCGVCVCSVRVCVLCVPVVYVCVLCVPVVYVCVLYVLVVYVCVPVLSISSVLRCGPSAAGEEGHGGQKAVGAGAVRAAVHGTGGGRGHGDHGDGVCVLLGHAPALPGAAPDLPGPQAGCVAHPRHLRSPVSAPLRWTHPGH